MIFIYKYRSPLGDMTMAGKKNILTGLWFDDQTHLPLNRDHPIRDLPIFTQTCRWLDIYFSGQVPDFTPALHMEAPPFRRAVWEVLRTIPYGQTVTYGQIAKIVGNQMGIAKMSAQAVGGAVGRNPFSIIVPCHRVVGANGNLTGYDGGIDKKIKLLALEKVDMSGFYKL